MLAKWIIVISILDIPWGHFLDRKFKFKTVWCLYFWRNGSTESCQNENFQFSQWRNFHQNYNMSVSAVGHNELTACVVSMTFLLQAASKVVILDNVRWIQRRKFHQHQWISMNDTLLWCHNGHDGVSNHQHHDCLLNRPLRRRSKKASKLRVTSLCAGNSPVTGEFPAQMASNAEDVSIWWRHYDDYLMHIYFPKSSTYNTMANAIIPFSCSCPWSFFLLYRRAWIN